MDTSAHQGVILTKLKPTKTSRMPLINTRLSLSNTVQPKTLYICTPRWYNSFLAPHTVNPRHYIPVFNKNIRQ